MPNLEQLYRTYTEAELMDAFSKRHQYTPEARAAMLLVINERGLSDVAEKEVERQEAETQASLDEQRRKFEEKMLGEHIPAKEYAKKSLVNGEYMSGKLTGNRFRILRILLLSIVIPAVIMAVLSVVDGPLFQYSLEVSIGVTVALLAIVIYSTGKSKARYRFYRPDSRAVFEVEQGSYLFKAAVPLNYFVYWYTIEYRKGALKTTHMIATLCITNNENETIGLISNLGVQSSPPDWPNLSEVTLPKGTNFFHETVTQRLNVVKIKKILDGLHD